MQSLNKSHYVVDHPKPDDLIFAFNDQTIYLIDEKHLPAWHKVSHYFNADATFYCFVESEKVRYLIAENHIIIDNPVFKKVNIKNIAPVFDDHLLLLAKKASHLCYWRKTHKYCGLCGTKNNDKKEEQAFICPKCQHITYPRISPCIIVLITHGEKILLARSPHFPEKRYSTLAGFVEPGESLEQTLHREVKEEVGVTISNITYFGSQPWPFPDSLMIGFHADYVSGEIVIDGIEIEDAQWFDMNKLPELPPPLSIGRLMIDAYIKTHLK
ncbi:MAG: hypothetical protein A3E81_01945 [Gammaproteobacteria bacterium RIFCSPHIGHO2_12_FULL_36_30]|nr:MAG: hypothetical protein A3E81_01945 [Gammaproteobacteria bacterium RIFCSPHIGHO2_12_FULL_36_30]